MDGGEVIPGRTATPLLKEALEVMDPDGLIERMDSSVRTYFRGVLLTLGTVGFGKCRVVSTRRTLEQQQEIFGLGRTKAECRRFKVPQKHAKPLAAQVTWIAPGLSRHLKGMAMDVSFRGYHDKTVDIIGHVARSFKCTWGGNWKVRDYGHFER